MHTGTELKFLYPCMWTFKLTISFGEFGTGNLFSTIGLCSSISLGNKNNSKKNKKNVKTCQSNQIYEIQNNDKRKTIMKNSLKKYTTSK